MLGQERAGRNCHWKERTGSKYAGRYGIENHEEGEEEE